MPEQVPFIGRKNEIAKIDDLIEKWGERQTICINGVGGIGKTRLLQEIRTRQTKKQSIQVAEIVDFDDPSLRNPENMHRKIGNMLDPNTFKPFLRDQVDYHTMQRAGVSPEGLERKKSEINQSFATCFNTLSKKKRILKS